MFFRSEWVVITGLLLLSFVAANGQSYDSEVQSGVAAYRNSDYEQAIQHFRKATELDPGQSAAHLYLATCYVNQYIPGVESPDNLRAADQAIAQYQAVLDLDADRGSKINSTKGLAYLYLNMKKFEKAKEYYQKAAGLDGGDPENYYGIGVIDWTTSYETRMEARAKLGMAPGENLDAKNDAQKKVCDELSVKNASAIEDGIDNLNKAIQLRPDYDDAMAYMNLMYREKADLECETPGLRAEDLKTADEWVDRTLAVKKAKANRHPAPTAPSPQ